MKLGCFALVEVIWILTLVASSARCDLKKQCGSHLQLTENTSFVWQVYPQVLRIRKSCELRKRS
jgi:hypothetical protein